MVWSNEQLQHWHRIYEEYRAAPSLVALRHDIEQQRQCVQKEMLQHLNAFFAGELTLKAFNAIFQQKANGSWNAFHVRGTSGGMFLNKLVKYIPDEEHFAQLLRIVLRLPKDIKEGHWWMQAFVRFLEGIIASRQATRLQLQPARVPFFLSIWWHIQDPERWPVFYLDVRQAFLTEDTQLKEVQDPVESYFAFRACSLALTQALSISSWELEHLASWWARRNVEVSKVGKAQPSADVGNNHRVSPQKQACVLASRIVAKNRNEVATDAGSKESGGYVQERMVSCRTHLQWLLAKLGHKVGCRVWIATSDHGKVCQHDRLGNLSLPSLPALADAAFQQIIRQIDVLWLLDNDIIAAYEIEQAYTDVSISLLRLYDLGVLFPERKVHLCVVAPLGRFEKVRLELSRPTFRGHVLRKHCALISEELLLQQEEHILRWASSPAVIEELICGVSDQEKR